MSAPISPSARGTKRIAPCTCSGPASNASDLIAAFVPGIAKMVVGLSLQQGRISARSDSGAQPRFQRADWHAGED